MLQQRQDIGVGFLKNLRNIYETNWSIVTEVDKEAKN